MNTQNMQKQDMAQIIFDDIYSSKKYKLGKRSFGFERYIDDTLIGQADGDMRLRIVTASGEYHGVLEQQFIMASAGNEAIIVMSEETPYLEEIAKENIEKAIIGGECYIRGEKLTITATSAKDKINAALEALFKSVYPKWSFINVFYESDEDIQEILSNPPEIDGIAGTGANNSDAIEEMSQWLSWQVNNYIPVSMGDVQKRYQGSPYGWREIDIAALAARLIVSQKISVKYGEVIISRDDSNLVKYLRSKGEADKTKVMRRITPDKELIHSAVKILEEYTGQEHISHDEESLVNFITNTFSEKRNRYTRLIEEEYSREAYPQKEIVFAARDMMDGILSQRRDHVALLTALVKKRDELLDSKEGIAEVENFFQSQKEMFDAAQKLRRTVESEIGYFAADEDVRSKINEIASILSMAKPYGRMGELLELVQSVRAPYGELLSDKREEVENIIVQCMGDIHTLAGTRGPAEREVRKSDEYFSKKKQETADAESIARLDTMIVQLLNYKDIVCKEIEFILSNQPRPEGMGSADYVATPKKIVTVRRYDVFPAKRLESHEAVDEYVNNIKKKLYETLESYDAVQLN